MSAKKQTLEQEFFDHEHVTVIEPQRGWRTLDLKELWAYRELLYVLAQRDIKVRYKQTVLGTTETLTALTRAQLMDDANVVVDDQTITSHVKRIRRKFLAVDPDFDRLDTVYGAGYRWKPEREPG